jgi:hypothetical protein
MVFLKSIVIYLKQKAKECEQEMSKKDAIVLTGQKETLKALEQFDKDAVKEFNKVINSELRKLLKKMPKNLSLQAPPLSGWNTQPARNPRSRGGAGWPQWDQSQLSGLE